MSSFQFKQFSIQQDRCAMKVGTDGVLLGAWADISSKNHVLDVGTGTGLIALMMAQRNPSARVFGIDIDEGAVGQAKENCADSLWADRITILHCDFNNPSPIEGMKFNAIVSNPPFFKEQVHAPDKQRDLARREEALPVASLLKNAAALLADDGFVDIIIPFNEVGDAIGAAAVNGLYLRRRCDVVTTKGKQPKRTLLEFCNHIVPADTSSITIYDENHQYTPEFIALTKDFYCKLS